jgi:hypothetical protein
LSQRIRAFDPFPGAHTFCESQVLKIWSASAIDSDTHSTPGTVVQLHADAFDVAAGDVKGSAAAEIVAIDAVTSTVHVFAAALLLSLTGAAQTAAAQDFAPQSAATRGAHRGAAVAAARGNAAAACCAR